MTMPRSTRGGDVAGLEPDAVERAYLEIGHQLDMGARQAGHAVAGRAADARAERLQRRERIRIRIDGMQCEVPLQPFDDLRPLRADQRYFDLFRHARSSHRSD